MAHTGPVTASDWLSVDSADSSSPVPGADEQPVSARSEKSGWSSADSFACGLKQRTCRAYGNFHSLAAAATDGDPHGLVEYVYCLTKDVLNMGDDALGALWPESSIAALAEPSRGADFLALLRGPSSL